VTLSEERYSINIQLNLSYKTKIIGYFEVKLPVHLTLTMRRFDCMLKYYHYTYLLLL